jgi:DNA-binding transcriptional LysR family regulator
LHFDPICSEPLVALVSRENPLAQKRALSIRDLQDVPLIASRRRDCRFHQPFLHNLFAPFGITPRIVESPQSCSVQFAYAAADEGVLIAPRSVAACAFPDIVSVAIQEDLPRITLGLSCMQVNNSVALKIFRQVALQNAQNLISVPVPSRLQSPARSSVSMMPAHREAS